MVTLKWPLFLSSSLRYFCHFAHKRRARVVYRLWNTDLKSNNCVCCICFFFVISFSAQVWRDRPRGGSVRQGQRGELLHLREDGPPRERMPQRSQCIISALSCPSVFFHYDGWLVGWLYYFLWILFTGQNGLADRGRSRGGQWAPRHEMRSKKGVKNIFPHSIKNKIKKVF